MDRMDGIGRWLFGVGPCPPRAYPARDASLARASVAERKGRGFGCDLCVVQDVFAIGDVALGGCVHNLPDR